MQHNYQTDLQTLIDLLAKETELYTKAPGNGKQSEIRQHKAQIDALVTEIMRRKKVQRMSDQGVASAS